MLAEERMAIILEIINEQKAVKLSQLCEMLDASISTVRRDINSLADMGKIVKVHGGAMVQAAGVLLLLWAVRLQAANI